MGGRPMPCHGSAANVLISYRIWKARALQDRRSPGQIDEREAMRGLAILEGILEPAEELVETVEHVVTCFGGEHGMHSTKAVRGWREAQQRRADREHVHPVARAMLQLVPEPDTAA